MDTPTIAIAWQNLSYHKTSYFDWKNFGRRQTLLRDLHGCFYVNSLNGILGQSGAGKTTLLKALSTGNHFSRLSPETKIFTRPTPQQPVSYFIEQHIHETIHSELTVKEVLNYAYQFKNGTQSTAKQMESHIDSVIVQLLLKKEVLDRKFGLLSGGEMRRVVIGQELMGLQSPDFMFCDELTTGLDSYAALEVIRCLSSLASANSQLTVIISIHAPSNELLEYFSQLYVLAKGGVAVYSGPPKELPIFLKQILPSYEAEESEEQPIETLIRYSCKNYQSSVISSFVKCTSLSEVSKIQTHIGSLTQQVLPTNYKNYSISDQWILLRRQLSLTFITQFSSFCTRLFFFVAGLVLISSFFNQEMTTRDGCLKLNSTKNSSSLVLGPNLTVIMQTYENLNYIYFNRLFQGFAFALVGVASFNSLIPIFRSEHRNGWYSTTVFFNSTLFVNIVNVTIYTLVLSTLGYFVVSEQAIDNYTINWRRLLSYQLLTWLAMFYGHSLGEAVSAVPTSYILSFTGTTFLYGSTMVLDNYFVPTDDLQWPVMRIVTDLVGMKYFVKYIIYIIYGLQRCDGENAHSWIMADFRVDPQQAHYYVLRMLCNIIVVKVFTYAVMLAKYSFHWNSIELPFRFAEKNDKLKPKMTDSMTINNEAHLVDLNENVSLSLKNNEHKSHTLLAFTNLTLNSKKSFYSSLLVNRQPAHLQPILRNINGQFATGTFNGILGCSGAGKTSLLKVLNGEYADRLSPETAFHIGSPLRKVFITQQVTDHLFSGLTARQVLVYASKLKNATKKITIDHEATALKLLEELAMPEAANRRVEHLSGGQQRRLILACELTSLNMPNLILADEIVSGLDTDSAEKVLLILKTFAENHNITICLTIHQPSGRFLSTFNSLFILSIGGVCVYSGKPANIREHLQLANIAAGKYPIETIIKASCAGPNDQVVLRLSELNTKSKPISCGKSTFSIENLLPNQTRFSLYSTWILFCRYFSYIYSSQWILIAFITVLVLAYGFLIRMLFKETDIQTPGCFSYDEDFNNAEKISESIFALVNTIKYTILISAFFILLISVPSAFSLYLELPLFYSEHRNGWYSTGAFLLMKSIMDILPLVVPIASFVYIIDIYDRSGLYWHLLPNLLLSVLVAQSSFQVFLITCDEILACICLEMYYLINVLLSNVTLPVAEVPVLDFLSQGTLFRQMVEAIMLRLYGFGRCGEREIQPLLIYMKLNEADYWTKLLVMLANFAFWKCLTLYLLVRKGKNKKRISDQQSMQIGTTLDT